MNKPIVFMFSGQGSQYYQMGKELYENHSGFRHWMQYCDEIVNPLIQQSLIDIIYQQTTKGQDFDRLLYSSPALLCIEYSLAQVLMEMGIKADFLLGYSLGEMTAAVISGNVSLQSGIQFVIKLANLIENESSTSKMLAILESSDIIKQEPYLFQNVWLTGKNFPKNFVVTGFPNEIEILKAALTKKNILFQELAVKYGFHTELLDSIETPIKQLIQTINFSATDNIPIFSLLSAKPKPAMDEEALWKIIRYPVDFENFINLMLKDDNYVFIDVGPSGTLATFMQYTLPSGSHSVALQTINRFGNNLQSLKKLASALSQIS